MIIVLVVILIIMLAAWAIDMFMYKPFKADVEEINDEEGEKKPDGDKKQKKKRKL